MVEHPGKMFCKFIMFPVSNRAGSQYLEFVHHGKGGIDYGLPGLSLGASEHLEKFSKKLEAKKLDIEFEHKNYEWKKNDKDRLPGWNFVTFPKSKSRIFTWLTEYEASKKRKTERKRDSKHPNQVYKVIGLEVTFDSSDVELFRKMCGKPLKNEFVLSCGTSLVYESGKKSRICSIVLATKNLSRLVKKFEWDELTTYKGQPAVLIKNPDRKMWDLVIIQG